MDSSVRNMKIRQQMEQLYFRKRMMLMTASVCRLFKRVGMDNRHPVLDMNMHKHGNATVIRNEEYQQQPFHIFCRSLFHAPFVSRGCKDKINPGNEQDQTFRYDSMLAITFRDRRSVLCAE